MTAAIKQKGVIYLDRNNLYFYEEGFSNVLKLDYQTDCIRDLEVINKDKLNLLIKTFIENNKLTPANLVIILSENVVFEKKTPVSEDQKEWDEVQKFLDAIPFEEIGMKLYKSEKETKIIATNRNLYEAIMDSFSKHGFFLEAVVPLSIFGKDIVNQNGIDFKIIFSRFEVIKKDSLLHDHENLIIHPSGIAKNGAKKDKNNTRLYALIGIFLFLLILFIIFLYQSLKVQ